MACVATTPVDQLPPRVYLLSCDAGLFLAVQISGHGLGNSG